jgi:hypothetical protein
MNWKEITARLTGISCPIFGLSWNPAEPEIKKARRVVAFLEDRRVLFNPLDIETQGYCIDSVIEIRQFLTNVLGEMPDRDGLSEHLRAIRAACRKFLDTLEQRKLDRIILSYDFEREPENYLFYSALGELRSAIGFRLGMIAVMYGLSVEDDLAKILPPKPAEDDA